MNCGEFKGSGLDKITGKPHDGSIISKWYQESKWSEIENYIKVEAEEFIKFCSWAYRELSVMFVRFKSETNLQ